MGGTDSLGGGGTCPTWLRHCSQAHQKRCFEKKTIASRKAQTVLLFAEGDTYGAGSF